MPAQFLTDSALNAALERILREAEEQLILISPFIKLHDRLQALLKQRLNDDKLFIQVVFGKNKENPSKSMSRGELEFFMQFPNIEIKYEARLHAKYYTNDKEGLITSMNLYDYSQDNNIESGILTSVSTLGDIANRITRSASLDDQALSYFDGIVKQATTIYQKQPEYEKVMFGLSKKYLGSKETHNTVDEFFASRVSERAKKSSTKTAAPRPVTAHEPKAESRSNGYCIRTGTAIPFNVKQPFTEQAFSSWSRYKDENYKEKYCHFSGEASNGETSYAKPILYKNWAKAKERFGL